MLEKRKRPIILTKHSLCLHIYPYADHPIRQHFSTMPPNVPLDGLIGSVGTVGQTYRLRCYSSCTFTFHKFIMFSTLQDPPVTNNIIISTSRIVKRLSQRFASRCVPHPMIDPLLLQEFGVLSTFYDPTSVENQNFIHPL